MFTLNDLMNPNKRRIDKSAAMNNATYNYYYTRMRNIAMTVYKWENLPDGCNARWLEKQLYYRGFAGFVPYRNSAKIALGENINPGWLSLAINPCDEVDIYGEALAYTAYSISYNERYERDEIVIVRNNLTSVPTDFAVRLFASRIYDIERAQDVNVRAQKTPVLILTDDKRRMTMKNVYMQYDGNSPFIFGDKSLDPDSVTVLKTDAPFLADKLYDLKVKIWSEFLTYLGIDNVGTEKRERLTNEEVSANNEHTSMQAETGLLTRREAAEQLSERCGQKVRVSLRTDEIQERELLIENLAESEGMKNGAVHNGIRGTDTD